VDASAAEHTIALLLCLTRGLIERYREFSAVVSNPAPLLPPPPTMPPTGAANAPLPRY
jgi:lactate dehydrogenase-like 2-hydroxyacid dehydrogenase